MRIIIIIIIFCKFGFSQSEKFAMAKVVDIINKIRLDSNMQIISNDELRYDSIVKASFDFQKFKKSDEGKKQQIYYSNGFPIRILLEGKNFNFEFNIVKKRSLIFLFTTRLNKKNLNSGNYLNGFFLINRNNQEVYFFHSKIDLLGEEEFSLSDINSIMLLEKKLKPISKLTFKDGNLKYASDFYFSKRLMNEHLYVYSTIDEEECNKYKTLNNLDINRLSHLFEQKYHCPVLLEVTGQPDVLASNPLWSYNGYNLK